MFGKKKTFPPGTFIPTKTRIVVILHMSLAFSLLVWSAFLPFMGEHFSRQTRTLLVQTLMGHTELADNLEIGEQVEAEGKLIRNQDRFKELSPTRQKQIQDHYISLSKRAKVPFKDKVKRSMQILAFEIPPFAQAWVFFSVLVCVFLLLRREGAQQAAWLLPLIVAVFGLNNLYFGGAVTPPPDYSLFPSEEEIVDNYLDTPLTGSILEQKEQLTLGWKRYLIKEWAKATPSEDPQIFDLQVEDGEYAFNLARLDKLEKAPLIDTKRHLRKKEHPYLLLLYFFWNLFFAIFVNRKGALA